MKTLFSRLLACLLIVALPAQAALVSTESIAAAGGRERVGAYLERADVQRQLESFGVSSSDVKARVDAMSDQEAAELAGRLDSLPAGGNAVIGAIVLIFIVLLVTDILGLTKIFPFTRSVR